MRFSTRRRIVRSVWRANARIDRALQFVIDHTIGEPRKHGFMWFVMAVLFTSCPVCLVWRCLFIGGGIGMAAGFVLGRLF